MMVTMMMALTQLERITTMSMHVHEDDHMANRAAETNESRSA